LSEAERVAHAALVETLGDKAIWLKTPATQLDARDA
jgi:hypothetical protein